jgi:hypothetical protein
MTTRFLTTLSRIKNKRVQVPGVVENGYQTQKRQSAKGWIGAIKKKARAALCSQKSKKSRRIKSQVPRDASQVSFRALLALGYERK